MQQKTNKKQSKHSRPQISGRICAFLVGQNQDFFEKMMIMDGDADADDNGANNQEERTKNGLRR